MLAPQSDTSSDLAQSGHYFDSVAVRTPSPLPLYEVERLAALCAGSRPWTGISPARVRVGGRLRWLQHIYTFHPGPAGAGFVRALAALARRRLVVLARVDLAWDALFPTFAAARDEFARLARTLVLRRHGHDEVRRVGDGDETVYYGRRGRGRVLAMYSGAHAARKHFGMPAVHLELRFAGPSRVRSLGVHRPDDLLDLNHGTLWRRSVALENVDRDALTRALGSRRRAGILLRAAQDEEGVVSQDLHDALRRRRLRPSAIMHARPFDWSSLAFSALHAPATPRIPLNRVRLQRL